ncbi:hypothetical protein AHiyo8_pII70390 (plasmid) [Arthrobacter sp. Hiyo8]|nr:hypothetical protein AHiyo8_pII70190 [Arthrobacter sp. Hiyo8]BAS18734.1 hypothetical protein AHiyo8_pII70390 [Arthrobacter sp. Hiyo8]
MRLAVARGKPKPPVKLSLPAGGFVLSQTILW